MALRRRTKRFETLSDHPFVADSAAGFPAVPVGIFVVASDDAAVADAGVVEYFAEEERMQVWIVASAAAGLWVYCFAHSVAGDWFVEDSQTFRNGLLNPPPEAETQAGFVVAL